MRCLSLIWPPRQTSAGNVFLNSFVQIADSNGLEHAAVQPVAAHLCRLCERFELRFDGWLVTIHTLRMSPSQSGRGSKGRSDHNMRVKQSLAKFMEGSLQQSLDPTNFTLT